MTDPDQDQKKRSLNYKGSFFAYYYEQWFEV